MLEPCEEANSQDSSALFQHVSPLSVAFLKGITRHLTKASSLSLYCCLLPFGDY